MEFEESEIYCVDAAKRLIGELEGMRIPPHDCSIARTRIEVNANGQKPGPHGSKGTDLAAEPCANAEHGRGNQMSLPPQPRKQLPLKRTVPLLHKTEDGRQLGGL
jgi:hypothetical protein